MTEGMVALIPAYEPDAGLAGYVDRLAQQGFDRIVVVDDGSGEASRAVFEELAAKPFCHVLHRWPNRGKGVSLKEGFAFIRERWPDAAGIVTADADGQHAPEDCRRLAESLAANPVALHLGCRRFSLTKVPLRSWIGNRWSSAVFGLLHGLWLSDTQTGLRAFSVGQVPFLLGVKGERFEYEMGVLVAAARRGVPVVAVPIRTIYEAGNASTHFRPLRDAVRINLLLFGGFLRFAGVSLASFALDQGLAWGFAAALEKAGVARAGVIWASGFAARFLSAVFNFSLNRTVVFRSGCGIGASAWKYALLCLAVIVLSNAGVTALAFAGVPRGLAKLVCDVLLYVVGYRVQSKFIFR